MAPRRRRPAPAPRYSSDPTHGEPRDRVTPAFWREYGSAGELLADVSRTPVDHAAAEAKAAWNACLPGRGEWAGNVKSLADACDQAATGVRRTFAPAALRAVGQVLSPAPAMRPTLAVAGGSPIVPRVLACRPDAMRRMRRIPVIGPTVRVLFAVGGNAGVSGPALEARGLAILGAVDAAKRAGVRAEVWAGCAWYPGGIRPDWTQPTGYMVRLAAVGAPLDWQRVAFWACHPAANRAVGFAWQDTVLPAEQSAALRACSRGHGSLVLQRFVDAKRFSVILNRPWTDSECYSVKADALLQTMLSRPVTT